MTNGTGGGEDEIDSEAWSKEDSYEAGYTEALADLRRGWYEAWVTEQSGDFEEMAEEITVAVKQYDNRGVRGREEIDEKLEEIDERGLSGRFEFEHGSGKKKALKWVLGRRDSL